MEAYYRAEEYFGPRIFRSLNKTSHSLIKILDNPERKATSQKRAGQFVAQGLAEWVDFQVSIRFKDRQLIRTQSRAEDDERYWNEIARQKGGSGEISCMWAPRYSGGYSVMQARVCLDAKG